MLDYKEVESCLLRVKGFKDAVAAINARPGGKVEIVAELPCGGARYRGYKAMEDMLQAHPDLAAVFAINDLSALGARAALEKAGGSAEEAVMVGDTTWDVEAAARLIVDDVAKRGDAALIEATKKFDRLELDASSLRVTTAEIEQAKALDHNIATEFAGYGVNECKP